MFLGSTEPRFFVPTCAIPSAARKRGQAFTAGGGAQRA
jgi:hypothetical protein